MQIWFILVPACVCLNMCARVRARFCVRVCACLHVGVCARARLAVKKHTKNSKVKLRKLCYTAGCERSFQRFERDAFTHYEYRRNRFLR